MLEWLRELWSVCDCPNSRLLSIWISCAEYSCLSFPLSHKRIQVSILEGTHTSMSCHPPPHKGVASSEWLSDAASRWSIRFMFPGFDLQNNIYASFHQSLNGIQSKQTDNTPQIWPTALDSWTDPIGINVSIHPISCLISADAFILTKMSGFPAVLISREPAGFLSSKNTEIGQDHFRCEV